ncbi:MAG: efflux RND transporter periplasmic adaptor subunit, partial [Tepidisphaeraceae bacterium]
AAPAGGRTVPVLVAAARKGDIPIYLTQIGTVRPLNTVTVRTRVDGEIEKVGFVEGQTVVKDQTLIVQIDPRLFEVSLAQAEGQLMKDQAALDNAQVELDRDLRAEDSIPKQQVDTQRALIKQYEGTVEIDKAQIRNARLQLEYAHITAPISGRIGLRIVDEGNIVHPGDANGLAVITQLQPIFVGFALPQDSIPDVLRAMKAATPEHPVQVEAFDRDLNVKLATGKLSAIDNQVDPTTGTVQLKAEFENKDDSLFPNQFVNVRVLVDTKKNAVIVPAAAVQYGPSGAPFVYVVKPDEKVEIRDVATGDREVAVGANSVDQIAIARGLAPGEMVVVQGVDKLQQGTKVAVRATTRPSGATRPVDAPSEGTTRPAGAMPPAGGARPTDPAQPTVGPEGKL